MTASDVAANSGGAVAGSYMDTVRLLAGAQKKAAPGAPPYSVYVNRRVGRFMAAWAFRRGLKPNTVSGISAAFTFSGIILLAVLAPHWWTGLLIWAALAVGYVLDSADGQVARLGGRGSVGGEWLDHVLDSIKISSLHLAVLVTAYLHFGLAPQAWLLVPIGYTIVAAVSFFAMILNDQLKAVHGGQQHTPAVPRGRAATVAKSILLLPTDYGVLCLVFLFLGAPLVFFVLYTIFLVANAGHLLLASRKWFRDMQKLQTNLSARSISQERSNG
ncbi:CDP-alcohol phosphatidyltransferase family protein [Arthrobacter sp. LAPM80]|uniref:CDP-alcohol phosphatidyltransferase family protein n=1 Tax=Arthrobacter sp. LAPM80 TaxID=3141788 RepID=UPI00398BA4DB